MAARFSARVPSYAVSRGVHSISTLESSTISKRLLSTVPAWRPLGKAVRSAAVKCYSQGSETSPGAFVVGAGPGGLASTGALLDYLPAHERVVWADPVWTAGRLGGLWREVPSNTKVGLFIAFAEALASFREAIQERPPALQALDKLNADAGCSIGLAADMCLTLQSGLQRNPRVECVREGVQKASWSSKELAWVVETGTSKIRAKRIVLCTGAHPQTTTLPIEHDYEPVPLDLALTPSKLSARLPSTATVGVVGASHSAVLALLNLFNLAKDTHPNLKIKWFTRHEPRYAEFKEGYILRDNTGLKGLAAQFSRENLDPKGLERNSHLIEKIDCSNGAEAEQFQRHGFSHLVQAVGFSRDKLPEILVDGSLIKDIQHDLHKGHLTSKGMQIPNAYGAGIAFPEQVTDPEGNVELSVGLWKFMRYLKEVVPHWVK